MNKILLLLFVFVNTVTYSQISEGQNFCLETKDGSYFPLSINQKKLIWANTSYTETKGESKVINGKTYTKFIQDWGNNNIDKLYLREENGVVYEYEESYKNETIRYDKKFENGHTWKRADNKGEYKIISYNGTLKTPYCEYKGLMVLDSKVEYGSFNFYYLKGYGYIGATKDGKLISWMTPE